MPITFEEAAPPASAERIAETERELGVSFPPSYRAFLERQNGGYLDAGRFGGEVTVERVFSAGQTDVEELEDLVSVRETYSGPDSDHDLPVFLLAIGGDPFGNLVCLSTEGEDAGTVYLWDHEIAEPGDAYRSLGVGLDDFLGRLEAPPDPA